MPRGLQIFDENSRVVFDTNDKIPIHLGRFTFSSQSGQVYISDFARYPRRTPYFSLIKIGGEIPTPILSPEPTVELNGYTISWGSSSGSIGLWELSYGVY